MQRNVIGAGSGISKTTPQASIIVNSLVDTDEIFRRGRTDHSTTAYPMHAAERDFVFDVKRGELCLTKRQNAVATYVRKEGVAPSLKIFSSLNGLEIKGYDNKESKELKELMLWSHAKRHLWFVGTAQGDKSYDMINNGSVSLAVRVSGSDTIINSGYDVEHNDTIYPGDTVAWKMPSPGTVDKYHVRSGEPKGKIMPVVHKYKPYEKLTTLINLILGLNPIQTKKLQEIDETFKETTEALDTLKTLIKDETLTQVIKLILYLKAE